MADVDALFPLEVDPGAVFARREHRAVVDRPAFAFQQRAFEAMFADAQFALLAAEEHERALRVGPFEFRSHTADLDRFPTRQIAREQQRRPPGAFAADVSVQKMRVPSLETAWRKTSCRIAPLPRVPLSRSFRGCPGGVCL